MSALCQDAVPLLGPLADGELEAADAAWVQEHLAGCDGCRARLQLIAAAGAALREQLALRAGPADFSRFADRVMARIASEEKPPLRERLSKRGIELIAPYRSNNKERRHDDGRTLRRYKRRWIVERTIAWLGNFRRPAVRYDRSLTIYRAFFHIACFMIVLRRVLK